MKNTRHIFYTALLAELLVLATLATSCRKAIEVPFNSSSQTPVEQVFADSSNIMKAVAGIYAGFKPGNYGFISTATLTTALASDELTPQTPYLQNDQAYYHNAIPAFDTNLSEMWVNAYGRIFAINTCIQGVDSTHAISLALKQQLTGEVKFMRAMTYFSMISLWGDVPLITNTDYRVNQIVPRTATGTIYNLIIADLYEAQQKLPLTNGNSGNARINKYIAEALLSKVYLYRGQFTESIQAANYVINSGNYALDNDLDKVFLNGSIEAIWQIAVGTQSDGDIFIPIQGAVPTYSLTPELLSAFEANDLRRQKWVGYSSVSNGNTSVSYFFPFKYKDKNVQVSTESLVILRLSEIYLIRAEAYARSGDLTNALADLKVVRSRAGLVTSNISTKEQVIDAILHERQTELFCEGGNRWSDLKRSGTIDAILGKEKNGWQSTDALFPIPQRELQANPYLRQNPGY
jgi:hypothetical protein